MTPLASQAQIPRYDETFPTLTTREIDRLRRFGFLRRYASGERLFETGRPGPGMFVVLSGSVAITQRDGLGHVTPVVEQGPGQFLAEVGQLSNRAALVDELIPNMPEVRLRPLVERFSEYITQNRALAQTFSFV